MSFLISNAQGIIGGDAKPSPEPLEILLANSRLKDIEFYLFSRGHSFHKQTKMVEEEENNR